MWHKGHLMLLLNTMITITEPTSGFAIEKSVDVPEVWNVAPSLEVEQKAPVDHALNAKIQSTIIDKVFETPNTKESMKSFEQVDIQELLRGKRSNLTLENMENETKAGNIIKESEAKPVEENEATDGAVSRPQNVVLLLVSETSQDEDLWKNFKALHLFPVRGWLQSCSNSQLDSMRFSLDDEIVSGRRNKECECEDLLRSNIVALFSWATYVRKMMTGTVFGTNFTIPSLVRKMKRENHEDWRIADFDKVTGPPSSCAVASNAAEDGLNERKWDMFNVFSRIKIALFRSLLEFLRGNMGTLQDEISIRKHRPLRSSFVDLVANTLMELQSVSKGEGYILVITTPGNELASAVEFLQHDISSDTLLIVTGVCTQNGKRIPFFAKGPAANMLHEVTKITDLPPAIRNVTSGCQGLGCKIRRHYILPFPLTNHRFIPWDGLLLRRIARDGKTIEKSSNSSAREIPLTAKRSNENDAANNEASMMENEMKRSTASEVAGGKCAALLGTAISILAMITLSSV